MINIYHCTENAMARHGLKAILNNDEAYKVVDLDDLNSLGQKVEEQTPDLIIINDKGLGEDVHTFIHDQGLRSNPTPVLLVADTSQSSKVLKVLDAGIFGFLTKECDSDEIVHAVHALLKGERFFCNNVLNILLDKDAIEEEDCSPTSLTEREIEITREVAAGLSTKLIADKLFISTHTVQTHRKNILRKLNLNSTSELIIYAIRIGLADPNSIESN